MKLHNTSMMDDFPYLYRGKVIDNIDPLNLGRCRIYVPSIHGIEDIDSSYLPWARVISTLPIGKIKGSAYVPDIGDIVWLFFEGGQRDSPVYIGGTQGTGDRPVELDKLVLFQEEEDSLIYDRTNNIVTIKLGNNIIRIKRDNIIDIISEGIVNVEADEVNITGTTTVNVTSSSIILNGNTTINGNTIIDGDLEVLGSTVLNRPVSCPGYCHHAS